MTTPISRTPDSAEAVNVRIAKIVHPEVKAWHDDRVGKFIFISDDVSECDVIPSLPDYSGSLDAMHEAWKTLPWDEQCAFSLKLHEVCGSNQLNHVVNATAAQRAAAFLTTKTRTNL